MDTIFALATARGRSGIAVLRISGSEAFAVAGNLVSRVPEAGRPALRRLRDAEGGVIDDALVLTFRAPRSFTGEDVVELHVHGSPAVIALTERALAATGLARPAEAGEFTRRALMNDKLDLAQVEGLGDLLQAETAEQHKQAMRLLQGALGDIANTWREDLLRAAALVEVTIDFADEEVPVDVTPEVREILARTTASLRREIAGSRIRERVRDGFEVAIIGAPNAGKSTLLNNIAGRDVAITSEQAGTTRDIIEVRIDLNGLPVTLLDTAGLRDTMDEVERLGVSRTRRRAEDADLRVWLRAGEDQDPGELLRPDDIVVVGKADEGHGGDVSGKTGEGVDRLLRRVEEVLSRRMQSAGTATRERHRHAMREAVTSLDLAVDLLERSPDTPELAAQHMRDAIGALDSLTGRIDVEAILGEIFSSFCIGK